MVRKLAAVLALAFVVACVSAEEYKGTITKVDMAKKTLTVKVDGDVKTLTYDDKTTFVRSGKDGGEKTVADLKAWAAKLKSKGAAATVWTEKKDGKETVTKVTVGGGKGGKTPRVPQPKKEEKEKTPAGAGTSSK
jgi:hypothetical protein